MIESVGSIVVLHLGPGPGPSQPSRGRGASQDAIGSIGLKIPYHRWTLCVNSMMALELAP